MKIRIIGSLALACLALLAAAQSEAALYSRVFVSARIGSDGHNCSHLSTPCQTLTGALTQLMPSGEAIVLDSGDYGAMTITKAVTINASPGITAFIHPSAGDAISVNAGASDVVTLRGLVLNEGSGNGIKVNSVGTLIVENCAITGFPRGITMYSGGRLIVKGTTIANCSFSGICIGNDDGVVQASLDHCHLDGNGFYGFLAATTAPGSSTTTASNSTANNNAGSGWRSGNTTNGQDLLNLEFCVGSENGGDGLGADSLNALSLTSYSNCVFANNANYGVDNFGSGGGVATRGNNTITGNIAGATNGAIGTFSPM